MMGAASFPCTDRGTVIQAAREQASDSMAPASAALANTSPIPISTG